MAAIKIRVTGGKVVFFSVYAPPNDHAIEERTLFFSQLEEFYMNTSVNGEKIICGDLNARLRCRYANEDSIIGEHFFRGIRKHPEVHANRNLVAQFCHTTNTLLANTFFDHDAEQLITYHEISAKPMDAIMDNKFAQLDYILCGQIGFSAIENIESRRELALASHHFILFCEMKESIQLEQ